MPKTDDQNNQPDKCLSRGQTAENWEYAFLIRPSLFWKECVTWHSHGTWVCKNSLMPLFDQGMTCAKTPSEYLASSRLLHSRDPKEI